MPTNIVAERLGKKNVTFEMIDEHLKKYAANNTKGFVTIFTTILMIAAIYASYFYIPYKLYWPFWVVLRAGCYFGVISSAFAITPFRYWQKGHIYHHGHVGDRGKPDGSRTILFTTEEYDNMVWYKKAFWRVVRDPIIFFTLVPLYQFFFQYRFQRMNEPHSHVPTIYMIVNYTILYRIDPTLAFLDFLGLWLGVIYGFLLFHWQHEVNCAYWVDSDQYNVKDASFLGSTHLLVPSWWKWTSLGIEYHHIHHLSTKVPCYNLQECHEQAPQEYWSTVQEVGLKKAFASTFNVMWNVKTQRFETFDIHAKFLKLIGLENEN
eukprot:gene8030-12495_t